MRYALYDIGSVDFAPLYEKLSKNNRARADKIKNEGEKKRHVCALALLSMLLCANGEGRVEFSALEMMPLPDLIYGKSGKPYFENGVFFSLSHSENAVLAAVSEGEIGADVQMRGKQKSRLAKKYFTSAEQKLDFYDVWTKKEASVKKSGKGISALCEIDTQKEKYVTDEFTDKENNQYAVSIAL